MKRNILVRSFLKIYNIIQVFSEEMKKTAISAFAGQSAFFMMLSFFPFIMFLLALLRFMPFTEDALISVLEAFVPTSFHEFLKTLISGIYNSQSATLLPVTIITSVWLASKSFLSLANGLNFVYEIDETRNFILIRIYAVIYTIIFALLIIASLTVIVFGNSIYLFIRKHIYFPFVQDIILSVISLRSVVSFFIMFCFFIIMYKAIPNRTSNFKSQVPGTLVATCGWLVFSWLYSFYVDHLNNYATFYGTMTVIALLMVWLYACMYILFFGGLINKMLDRRIFKN